MNLPNGYMDETGTSYSDTWVHQDNNNTQSSTHKKGFFNTDQWVEISLHNEWMESIKGKYNQPSYQEWLKTK